MKDSLFSGKISKLMISTVTLVAFIIALIPQATATTGKYVSVNGTSITKEDFSERYGSSTRTDLKQTNTTSNDTDSSLTLEVSYVSVSDDNLVLEGIVSDNGSERELAAKGRLYNSARQQSGADIIVGDLQDEAGNFDIIYFGIFNDDEDAWFYSDSQWYMKPHLKVYLEDTIGNLLLFEAPIPDTLRDVEITSQDSAPAENDIFWFMPYITSYTIAEVPGTGSEADVDGNYYVESTALKSGGETYYLPEYELEALFNGVIYENTAQPSIYFDINNISSTGYWRIDFGLENCATTVYGDTYPGSSFIAFSNIQFAVGTGQYTTLDYYTIFGDGNKKSGLTFSEGSSIAINLVTLGANALGVTIPPVGVAASTIKSILEATTTKTNVVIGSQYSDKIEPQSLGIGITLPSGYTLTDEGHNFCIKVDASFDDFGDDVSSIDTLMSFRCFFDYGTIILTGTHHDSTGYINVPYYVADR